MSAAILATLRRSKWPGNFIPYGIYTPELILLRSGVGAQPMDDRILRPAQVAKVLGVTPSCLARWRTAGDGPAFYRLAVNAIGYRESDIEAWLAERREEPGKQAK